MTESLPVWIIALQLVAKSVLVLLVGLSIWSIATMIRCSRLLDNAKRAASPNFDTDLLQVEMWIDKKEWDHLKAWSKKEDNLYTGTLRAILDASALGAFQVERAVKTYLSMERTRLEDGLTILATLGSNAPFVGLFGTVLGIIQAFAAMGVKQGNSAEIMSGISEALVATAVGLFVAIPAVMAFNIFTRRLRVLLVNSEALKDLYLSKTKESH